MIAHELEPLVVSGLQSNQVVVYDYKQQKEVSVHKQNEPIAQGSRVQSMAFVSNCMKLVVGYSSG